MAQSGFAELLKKKPKVPQLATIDFEKEQAQALQENIANLPLTEQLAGGINRINVEQFNKAAEQMLPGYANIRDTITKTLQSGLEGQLPRGVEESIRRRAAERGIAMGTSGSGFQSADELRNLGLNELAYAQQNLDAASRWLQTARAPTFDVSSMMFTPQQRVQIRFQENVMKFNRDWLRNQIAAIPSGWKAVGISALNYVANAATTALSVYSGGLAGGAGGSNSPTAGSTGGGGGGGGVPWWEGPSGGGTRYYIPPSRAQGGY